MDFIRAPTICLVLIAAGCAVSIDEPGALVIWAHETAQYDILLLNTPVDLDSVDVPSDAQAIGTVAVAYADEGDHVVAWARIDLVATDLVQRDEPYDIRLTFDATTGALVEADGPHDIQRPIGARRTQPNVANLLLGLFAQDMSLEAVPLGPQWALASGEFWGDSTVKARSHEDGWSIQVSAPCDVGCSINGGGHQLSSFYVGEAGLLLPRAVRHGGPGLPIAIQLERTASDMEGAWRPVEAATLYPSLPSDNAMAPCGVAPCDGPDWPSRLSLADGADFLTSSPQFAVASTVHGDMIPMHVAVGGGTTTVLQVPVTDSRLWYFRMLAPDGAVPFFVEQRLSEHNMPFAAITQGPIDEVDMHMMAGQEWPTAMVPLAMAIEPALERFDMGSEDLVGLAWHYTSPVQTPDLDLRSMLYVPIDPQGEVRDIWISATTGDLVRITRERPALLDWTPS